MLNIDAILEKNQQLPIVEVLGQVREALQKVDLVIVKAPPGAGKTTLLPLSLLPQKILMLEPRRMAAKTAAHRLADLLQEPVGQTVGYKMRQESRASKSGKIEVITEGLLGRMLQDDPALESVDVVIFDEFHERSLNNDLSLALCLKVNQVYREDRPIKLIIMSASLDGIDFSALNQPCEVIESLGKQYPVDLCYQDQMFPLKFDYEQLGRVLIQALLTHDGGVLVFVPGQREVHQTLAWIDESAHEVFDHCQSLPLYGSLNLDQQMSAVKPLSDKGKRKIVVATDIAEASLTITDVAIVIDSGLCRSPAFDLKSGFTRLETKRISQASSTQRAGRAGRTQAGVCYRLWPESQQQSLAKQHQPEILQADLSPLLLQLLSFGEPDVQEYAWIDLPREAQINQAKDLLFRLQAIDQEALNLSDSGHAMTKLPAHPRMANMLLKASQADARVQHIASVLVSILQESKILPELGFNLGEKVLKTIQSSRSKKVPSGIQRVLKQSQQYLSLMRSLSLECVLETEELELMNGLDDQQATAYLLGLAFPDRIAKPMGQGRYKLSNGKTAQLFDANLREDQWLVIAECGGQKHSADLSIFSAVIILESDFLTMYQHQFTEDPHLYWHEDSQTIRAESRRKFQALKLRTQNISLKDVAHLDSLWLSLIQAKGFEFLPLSESASDFLSKVGLILSLPKSLDEDTLERFQQLTESSLLGSLEQWLLPFMAKMTSYKQLQALDWLSMLKSVLSWQDQQLVEQYCPERFTVPSGSNIRIDYHQSPPVLAVKLQEMFGQTQTPSIVNVYCELSIHLLSPAGKPLQITQDLSAFWQGAYQEVKKEMKGRYPKHPWPDDPSTAQATFLTKKRLAEKNSP